MIDSMSDPTSNATIDLTTEALETTNAERARLRAEVLRLSQALAACTDAKVVSTERAFIEGYDQAVGEIRDHFRQVKETAIVAEIDKIWRPHRQISQDH